MAKTVLIADDVEYVRKTVGDILSRAHYLIAGEAKSGTEVVELYFKLRPDLVTMDIVMPEMSGIEAIRKIMKRDKEAKIIVISAMGQDQLAMEAIAAGARDYIIKPFHPQDLLKSIQQIFSTNEQPSRVASR